MIPRSDPENPQLLSNYLAALSSTAGYTIGCRTLAEDEVPEDGGCRVRVEINKVPRALRKTVKQALLLDVDENYNVKPAVIYDEKETCECVGVNITNMPRESAGSGETLPDDSITDYVRVECEFRDVTHKLGTHGLFMSENYDSSVEFLTLDHKSFAWSDNGLGEVDADPDLRLTEKEAPGMQIRRGVWEVTLHAVPNSTEHPIQELMGFSDTINSVTHYSQFFPNLVFPPASLLMATPSYSKVIGPYDVEQFEVTISMSYNPADYDGGTTAMNGWNLVRRAAMQTPQPLYWYEPETTGGVFEIYNSVDWSQWLPVTAPA